MYKVRETDGFKLRSGFTLVELLVVISIIGILASIILVSLSTTRAKGRDSKRISDIKQIQLALELYNDANGQFPDHIYGSPSPLVSGGYIPAMPSDPSASTPCTADSLNSGSGCYYYVALATGGGPNCTVITSYHLGAPLEIANSAVQTTPQACKGTNATMGQACTYGGGVKDNDYCSNNGAAYDFYGDSVKCDNTAPTNATVSQCFDAKP